MTPLKYDSDGRILVDASGDIVAWANSKYSFFVNGSLVGSDTADAIPSAINQLWIGNLYSQSGSFVCPATYKRLAIFNQSAPDAFWESLTAQ